MTWLPISGLPTQFSKNAGGASASGYWLKFYRDGTTTVTSMATDSTGAVTLVKAKLNTRGEPLSNQYDDDSVFIPFLSTNYKAALYLTEADADADDTNAALWVVDSLGLNTYLDGLEDAIDNLELSSTYVFDSVADMISGSTSGGGTIAHASGQNYRTLGFYSVNDGGGSFYVVGSSTADGHSLIDLGGGNTAELQVYGEASIDQFGAAGDFDPSTGLGTDDREAIQATINYMVSSGGGIIRASNGKNYYLGTGYDPYRIGSNHQVSIGAQLDVSPSILNIHLKTAGATFYPGAEGKTFVFANAINCSWDGFKCIGFTGGALYSGRENDAPILINKNCDNISIYNHYITNSLGDCITISPDVLVAGGGTGSTPKNITVRNGTMKERWGDGVLSLNLGTRSREAIAVIEGEGIHIHDNIIYGSVDLEPNLDGQYLKDIKVSDNICLAGHVTPQAVIGTDYWFDEPTALTGGTLLTNDIKLLGVAGAPIISGVVCQNNSIENGSIASSRAYAFELISGNVIENGRIWMAEDNVVGYMVGTEVSNNICRTIPVTTEGFIFIQGQVASCVFSGNILLESGPVACIHIGAPSVGPVRDGGNYFHNNRAPNGASDYSGNYENTSVLKTSRPFEDTHFSAQKVFTIVGTSLTVDWSLQRADCWYIQQAASTVTSISNISNDLGDGHIIEIMAEASGGGSLTVVHSGSIVLKGAVNAVLGSTNVITLRKNFGRWVEVSRNF